MFFFFFIALLLTIIETDSSADVAGPSNMAKSPIIVDLSDESTPPSPHQPPVFDMTLDDTKFPDDVQVPEDNEMVLEVPTNMPDKSILETGVPEEVGSGSVVLDSSAPDDRVSDNNVLDPHMPEDNVPDSNMPDDSIPKAGVLDSHMLDPHMAEDTVLEDRVLDSNMPNDSVRETGVPDNIMLDPHMPEDRVPDTTEDLPSTNMPPPASQIPKVKLLPPTPNTSQEAATSLPMMLLAVPQLLTTSDIQPGNTSRSCSRTRSPVPDPSQLQHSP